MASTELVILSIIAISVFILIYVPCLAYFAYKTSKYSHHVIMHKRQSPLTIVLSILSICWILSFVFAICVYTFIATDIAISISNFLIISIYISFTYTLIWRLWFIYFNIIYNISMSHVSWQQLIHNEAGANNWYLKEKTMTKWGNPQYVQKFMLYLIFGNVILYGLFHFITIIPIINFIIRLIIIFIPWLGILWIYHRIPSFHDDIGIAEEIKYVMIGYFMMGVFFICLFIAVSILTNSVDHENNDLLFGILYCLAYHLVAFSAFGTSMMMTWWPLKKFLISNDDLNVYQGISNDSPRKAEKITFNKPSINIKLEDICLTMFGMDLLMKFLEKEYSRENLLFIIEVTLLQRSIYQHIESNQRQYAQQKIDLNQIANNIFILPSTCPKSTIVDGEYEEIIEKYKNNGNNGQILSYAQREQIRFKHILYEMYMKYIANSSELSVNISSNERAKLVNLCNDPNKWMKNKQYDNDMAKLVNLYESPKQEIIKLIKSDSLPRFKLKNEYQKIREYLEKIQKQAAQQQIDSQQQTEIVEVNDESTTTNNN